MSADIETAVILMNGNPDNYDITEKISQVIGNMVFSDPLTQVEYQITRVTKIDGYRLTAICLSRRSGTETAIAVKDLPAEVHVAGCRRLGFEI